MPEPKITKPSAKTEATVRAEERMRFKAIMESPEAQARPKTALRLALYGQTPPEIIREMLADLPAESPFLAAMEREGRTGVISPLGAAIASDDPKSQRLAELKEAANRHNAARGYLTPAEARTRGVDVRV